MNDKKSEKPANPEKMQDLLYHFTVLHERWAADKLELTKQITKSWQLFDELTEKIHEFEKKNMLLGHTTVFAIREMGDKVNEDVVKTIKQTLGNEVRSAVGRIGVISAEAREELNKWKNQTKIYVIAASLMAMFLCFFFGLNLGIKSNPALTDGQSLFLTSGQIIARIYPELSPEEQKHLQDLSGGAMSNLLQAKETTETQK